MLETIDAKRLIHLGGFPYPDHHAARAPGSCLLRFVVTQFGLLGGAPSSPELIRRIAETLAVTISVRYSSTEVGIATASSPDDPPEILTTTVGKPTAGVELRIVGADQRVLPAGEIGEVVVRSGATMRRYWRAPELSAQVIDPEGWIHTGDLGSLDEQGYLRLKGRGSEMYIRGGYNVYPAEVENVLARHPKVSRAAVIGIPDATFGELGCAFIVPRAAVDPPSLRELREFVGAELASFKRPDRLELIEQLPLTPMFKVDKKVLSARLPRT